MAGSSKQNRNKKDPGYCMVLVHVSEAKYPGFQPLPPALHTWQILREHPARPSLSNGDIAGPKPRTYQMT